MLYLHKLSILTNSSIFINDGVKKAKESMVKNCFFWYSNLWMKREEFDMPLKNNYTTF